MVLEEPEISCVEESDPPIWPSSDLSCAIAAPTRLAAFNVGMNIQRWGKHICSCAYKHLNKHFR